MDDINENQTSADRVDQQNDNADEFEESPILRRLISVRSESSMVNQMSDKIATFSKNKATCDDKEKTVLPMDKHDLAYRVRMGEITPFEATSSAVEKKDSGGTFNKKTQLLDLERYIFQQAELARRKKQSKPGSKAKRKSTSSDVGPTPGKKSKSKADFLQNRAYDKKKKAHSRVKNNTSTVSENVAGTTAVTVIEPMNISLASDATTIATVKNKVTAESTESINDNEITPKPEHSEHNAEPNENSDSGSEYLPSDDQADSDDQMNKSRAKKSSGGRIPKASQSKAFADDGDEWLYRQRVEDSGYKKKRVTHKIDNLFKVPQSIWKRLYKYQRVSVQWLWELHRRDLGGLLGDEMGLGKTVQVIAFLAGLDCSNLLSDGGRFRGLGPSLIVCPATLLEQWVRHFHLWWPTMRVATLHQMGTYKGDPAYLIHSLKCGGLLVTSYSGVLRHKDLLVKAQWHYVILDEGHKIRNPDAKITKAVKQFTTPHRLLLTGSPMQNSLKELWSLFDFILPGKLGTLPAFMEHFAAPIMRGGYTNASALQEATALNVATMLNDAITPYMLRRTKDDVKHHVSLPEKNEQVLFCSLTEEQRQLYKSFLRSEDVSFVLHERSNSGEGGRYKARLLVALTSLRKICNHPDLFIFGQQVDSDQELEVDDADVERFGYWKRAGKMSVVRSLLKIWKKQGHRVLLFTQSRQMMGVLEALIQREQYKYLRMDGTTPMSQRQQDIRLFNSDDSYFVFVLTTRVGGLGVNLTGANRVIIYDPDWNPATDAQARERAWRIGQNKNVTIYRLITAGTIEEKMYHRQIFKQLLCNKVLEDPRQRRLFRTSDLTELFALNEPVGNNQTESEKLFRNSKLSPDSPCFSSNKVEAMRKLAASLSKSIGKKANPDKSARKESAVKDEPTMSTDPGQPKKSVSEKEFVTDATNETTIETVAETMTDELNDAEDMVEEGEINDGPVDIYTKYDFKFLDSPVNSPTDADSKEANISVDEERQIKVNEMAVDEDSQKKDDGMEETIDRVSDDKFLEKCENQSNEADPEAKKTLASEENNTSVERVETSEACEDNTKTPEDIEPSTDIRATKIDAQSKAEHSEERKKRHKSKRGKKSSRKTHEEVSALFEGERIACLVGRRLGHSQPEDYQPSDDQYVLRKLFAKSSVSTAFQHDSILTGARRGADEGNLVQRQALRAAEESMDQLRQSRKWCWKPTWDKVSESNDD